MGNINGDISVKSDKSYNSLDVIDKDDVDGIIYPALRSDYEIRLKNAKNEIIPLKADEHRLFSLNFRMKNIVIDSLARKYNDTIGAYPAPDEDGERVLIGVSAIKSFLQKRDCPYMNKVFEVMEEQKINEELIGICLLDISDSEVNRQTFLALSRSGIYLRKKTLKIDFFPYENLYIGTDRIERKDAIEAERDILDYLPSDEFCEFLQEIMLLRRTTLLQISERHPFADVKPEDKEKYLAFLTDAAAAEGKLEVRGLIYLEYLARNFNIGDDKLTEWLEEAYAGGLKNNELHKRLTELLTNVMHTNKYYVFFMDIIELIVGKDGSIHRTKLLEILKRKNGAAGGEKFIENFAETVKLRRQAERYMIKTLQTLGYMEHQLYSEDIRHWQNYRNELGDKLLNIGVRINERK